MLLPPCAGIIVINSDETILVSTKTGNYSFPKGKKEGKETTLETAWRELFQETGLDEKNVQLIENFTIDELSDKGNLAIRYFVGIITNLPTKLTFDENELKNCEWVKVVDAYELEKLKPRRKEILKQAYQRFLTF